MGTKARILLEIVIDDVRYEPNQVVDLPAAQAKALRNERMIDTSAEAVAYCIEQGTAVIVHQGEAAAPVIDSAATAPVIDPAATAPVIDPTATV
jgi:hypothetical protein